MKRKTAFLLLATLVVNSFLLRGQEQNVTDTYLANAGFDSSCNYKAGDAASNLSTSTDGSTVLEVANWTKQFEGWSAGASFEYGYAGTLNAPGPVPSTGSDGSTTGSGHGALGVCAAWAGKVVYYQNVTLPAGSYKLKYKAYNSGAAAYSVSLAGFVPDAGTSALSALTGFTQNEWISDEINFTLDAETTGKIQLGVAAQNAGSGLHGRIFFDDLQLLYSAVSSDATLSAIQLSAGVLSPVFNSAITSYTVSLAPGTTSVEVTAVKRNSGATVAGAGTIPLENGEGKATILVTAADGITTKTYTVNFLANYMYEWDGGGATGAGSEPNNFGWDCTPAIDAWAEANVFGVRFQDNVSYSYHGSALTGRILYVRWDGAGGASTSSVYSYPAADLKACTTYMFEAKVAWNSNGGATSYAVEINSAKDNSGVCLAKDKVAVSSTGELHDVQLLFTPHEDGDYYFTLGSSSAVLGAIRDLSLTEYNGDPFIRASVEEMKYDSTELSQSFEVSAYGLTEAISFTTPEGMTVEPATISAQEAQCGVTVTAAFESKEAVKDGEILMNSGEVSKAIIIKKVLPPYMAPGTAELTTDGTWCWFQDPRAVYYEGNKKQTYTGWITSKGKVEVASYNHETGEIIHKQISPPDFMQIDDHNNPTILVREDGRIMVSYSGHFYGPMRVIVSTNPEDITSFGPEANFGNNVTYANPYQIGDSTVMFYRDGDSWHPTMNVSMDGGLTWGTPQTFITGGGQRPYVKYAQDRKGGIHITFTTGHPRNEPNNKIYYAYYKDGKFYRADGTFIKDYTGTATALDISAGEPEMIYDASKGKGWTWDIALDKDENPVILYAAFPDDLNHHYYYAGWDGTQWVTNHIVNSGRWFPQTPEGAGEPEPNYSGGMALDPNDPSVVYLSKQVSGVFEIYKYVTSDRGATWQTTAITENTPEGMINVRPVIPRGHKPGSFDVMWLRGMYVTYANYLTSVMFYSPNTLKAELDSILIDGVRLNAFQPNETSYTVGLPSGATEIPEVQGVSNVPLTRIEVTQATSVPGQALITVTSEGGVTAKTYVIEFMDENTTSVSSPELETFKVYPSPATGFFKINTMHYGNESLAQLINISGQIIISQPLNEETTTIQTSHLPKGAYIVVVKNKESRVGSQVVTIK